jgi:hypothetical protein
VRRGTEDDRIANLPPAEQADAQQREIERRARYDSDQNIALQPHSDAQHTAPQQRPSKSSRRFSRISRLF